MLCHACQKPSTEIRSIIPCSACTLYWHIDCLDPPLAVPPVLKTWRCPAHVDDVLIDVPGLAPAHRFRKVKNSQPIAPAIWRGLKNNGHVEIDWPDEPDEQDQSGWRDYRSFGRTYKLSAKGVILDFIQQYGHHPPQHIYTTVSFSLPLTSFPGCAIKELATALGKTSSVWSLAPRRQTRSRTTLPNRCVALRSSAPWTRCRSLST